MILFVRYFLLSIIFVGLGAFVSQLSWFRTTYAPYSVFFVQSEYTRILSERIFR